MLDFIDRAYYILSKYNIEVESTVLCNSQFLA